MSEPAMAEDSVRIERTMRAGPERVFQAWLDADLMRQWLHPGDLDIDSISLDPKVGGKILITHSRKGQSSGSFQGEYVKIVPPRELVYRWAFVGTEPEKGEFYDSLVTITLRPLPGGGTRLTILHEQLAKLHREVPEIYAQVESEWKKSLNEVDEVLVTTGAMGTGWSRGAAHAKGGSP